MADQDQADEDRAAILARRNRLIAIALSGIGAAAGCGDPSPCLRVAPADPVVHEPADPQVSQESNEAERTPPRPCLTPRAAPPDDDIEEDEREERVRPQVCLSVVPPPEDPVPESEADGPGRPIPRPCLSPPRRSDET